MMEKFSKVNEGVFAYSSYYIDALQKEFPTAKISLDREVKIKIPFSSGNKDMVVARFLLKNVLLAGKEFDIYAEGLFVSGGICIRAGLNMGFSDGVIFRSALVDVNGSIYQTLADATMGFAEKVAVVAKKDFD